MNCVGNLSELYYIMDGSGNYYRVDRTDQLVVSCSRDEATVFNFVEANQRIGTGKKAGFYSTIPIEDEVDGNKGYMCTVEELGMEKEDTEETMDTEKSVKTQATQEKESVMNLPYDMSKINWKEYMLHFSYVVSGIKNYQDELNEALSDVDMKISDILHYVEFNELYEEDSLQLMELLKQYREERRQIKDEQNRVEYFQKAIGTSENVAKAKAGVKQIEKLNTRKYNPRKLRDLFKEYKKKQQEREACASVEISEEEACIIPFGKHTYDRESEETVMEYVQKETIFDGKKNDWRQFARQQMEFYTNAEQYICNLKIYLQELDIRIEETLELIEDANYNVAQGYKVFKILKDYRNERKDIAKELESLETLTVFLIAKQCVRHFSIACRGWKRFMGKIIKRHEDKRDNESGKLY